MLNSVGASEGFQATQIAAKVADKCQHENLRYRLLLLD